MRVRTTFDTNALLFCGHAQVLYALGSVGDHTDVRWASSIIELLHRSIRETNNLARSLPALNLLGRLLHTYESPFFVVVMLMARVRRCDLCMLLFQNSM